MKPVMTNASVSRLDSQMSRLDCEVSQSTADASSVLLTTSTSRASNQATSSPESARTAASSLADHNSPYPETASVVPVDARITHDALRNPLISSISSSTCARSASPTSPGTNCSMRSACFPRIRLASSSYPVSRLPARRTSLIRSSVTPAAAETTMACRNSVGAKRMARTAAKASALARLVPPNL